jgi:hypothetical protein
MNGVYYLKDSEASFELPSKIAKIKGAYGVFCVDGASAVMVSLMMIAIGFLI